MTVNHGGKLADPRTVARKIVSGLHAGRRVIYAPSFWRLIMLMVRNIPFVIFKRLKF
jgi:short-subunit dehydrogenase